MTTAAGGEVEGDGDAPLKAHQPQPGPQVIPADAALREGLEGKAIGPDALGVAIGAVRAGLIGDEVVELEKVVLGFRRENNGPRHARSFFRRCS